MRSWIGSLAVLLVAATVVSGEGSPRLADLDWLAGHWRGPATKGTWEARYTTSEGGMMLSVNKQLVDGKVITFEFERFTIEGDALIMTPFPRGKQSSVHFTLTALDKKARRAVFENPEHDFPQTISYECKEPDRLRIGVHAMRDGQRVGFELDLARQL